MATQDLYEVLGLKRGAGVEEIRRAYRKLARELHPDVNKAPDAAKRFAKVQEAYETLSDDKKRNLYDTYGSADPRAAERGEPGSAHYTWSNVGGGGPFGGPGGVNMDAEDLGSVFEAIFGSGPDGFGSSRSSGRSRPSNRKGGKGEARTRHEEPEPVHHAVRVSFMTAAKGGTEQLRVVENGKSRTIEVKIPPGINGGTQLRVRGGAAARGTGGDILLTVHIDGHSLFRRGEFEETGRGLDIYLDVPVTIAEATLGGAIVVPTLDDPVEVTLPQGTSSGRKLRLRGKGISDGTGTTGDLYAVIKIVPPDPGLLSPEDRQAIRDIAAFSAPVRRGPVWPVSKAS